MTVQDDKTCKIYSETIAAVLPYYSLVVYAAMYRNGNSPIHHCIPEISMKYACMDILENANCTILIYKYEF